MKVTVHPSKLKGNVKAPTSKSAMQRACAASLLAQKPCTLYNIGKSNDDIAALGIIKKLGATIEYKDYNTLLIDSSKVDFNSLNDSNVEINCGESGLSIRMFTPIAALFNNEILINGDGSLTTRPMNFFDEILITQKDLKYSQTHSVFDAHSEYNIFFTTSIVFQAIIE